MKESSRCCPGGWTNRRPRPV
ncbi:rCG34396 [Rattus norvegicus]|uniref:RCG34396 n=1 Tax=Rattus norvegicus TaxID=10116 RepID=A6HDD2_RAT|nr:rCG34396 [Rattus norvegicus]